MEKTVDYNKRLYISRAIAWIREKKQDNEELFGPFQYEGIIHHSAHFQRILETCEFYLSQAKHKKYSYCPIEGVTEVIDSYEILTLEKCADLLKNRKDCKTAHEIIMAELAKEVLKREQTNHI